MGDGFTADPSSMLGYAAQLGQHAGQVGTADSAASTVINENSGKLGPVTDELTKLGITKTGQLDRAYGALCQPYGIILQNMQQQVETGIQQTMALMSKLAANLRECAHNYQEADRTAETAVKKALSQLDQVAAAPRTGLGNPNSPGLPALPTPPKMPVTPALPDHGRADD